MLETIIGMFTIGFIGAGLCKPQKKSKKRYYRKYNNYSKKLYEDGSWFNDHGFRL